MRSKVSNFRKIKQNEMYTLMFTMKMMRTPLSTMRITHRGD